jgi:hypothetical protein
LTSSELAALFDSQMPWITSASQEAVEFSTLAGVVLDPGAVSAVEGVCLVRAR